MGHKTKMIYINKFRSLFTNIILKEWVKGFVGAQR